MQIRQQFPIFRDKTFINSCSKGALSEAVRAAYEQYLEDWQTHGSPWELWVDKLEALRLAVAHLLNATANEIAITASVSASVNALASSLDFSGERNEVVVDDFAFPTTAQIWHAQAKRGAKIVHVPEHKNRIPLDCFDRAINEKTKLVSLTHVCYRNGVMQDVAEIIKMAHAKGALVLLDSYQAAGTMPIDVQTLQPDFLVGGMLKYLLGSSGVAFLYGRNIHLPTLTPTNSGWFSQDNIFDMDIYKNTPSLTARRFEAGTPPNPNLYAALAGIKIIQAIGLDKINAHLHELTSALKEEILKRGYQLVSPRDPKQHGALITIRAHDDESLVKNLAHDGIIISNRDNNIRVSPHIYNNLEDIEHFIECLARFDELLVKE